VLTDEELRARIRRAKKNKKREKKRRVISSSSLTSLLFSTSSSLCSLLLSALFSLFFSLRANAPPGQQQRLFSFYKIGNRSKKRGQQSLPCSNEGRKKEYKSRESIQSKIIE
jgi:hypothetical protein